MNEVKDKSNKKGLMFAIIGVMTLVVAVAGSTYAYYAASVSNKNTVTGTAGGGSAPVMNLTKITTGANGNLIPINMDTNTLTSAAKASPTPCKDKNGYTACQIYKVSITNNSNNTQQYNINLTSLTGTTNVDAVTMGNSSNTVSSAASIKENGTICKTNDVKASGTSTDCYFMVFIKNLDSAQTDSGTFNGVVTAVSTTGATTQAQF